MLGTPAHELILYGDEPCLPRGTLPAARGHMVHVHASSCRAP